MSATTAVVTIKTETSPAPIFAKNTTIGSRGKSFLVLFMKNIMPTTKSVYVTSDNGTDLNITTSPNLNPLLKSQIDRQFIHVLSYQHVILPSSMELESFRKEKKAILFETSNDVFVISHDNGSYSTGSTTHIPLHQLSTEYIVISTPPSNSWNSQLAVASVSDNTTISITFKMETNSPLNIGGQIYRSGDTFNLTLDIFETYQIAHSTDLTGTVIKSSDPIATFSGNDCNTLENFGACDHLIEQLPPIESVDNTYIVPPYSDDRNTKIRITAMKNTNVTYSIGGVSQTLSLDVTSTFDTHISSTQSCFILSENSILVTSFGLNSKSSNMGDPSMTIVPGIHQYLDYYKIVVPTGYVNNFVSIMIDASFRGSVQINGLPIQESAIIFEETISTGNDTFNVRSITVTEGEVTVSTVNGRGFGLMFSGTKDYEAYGFSGNSLLLHRNRFE
ncbi:uncharacterized protein LOC133195169 [Saccostrea echinata]|uniref:uncharacterized protein LOC133195169 n=1 Tax=Saccostrea echinata TaxID=191078 RepID=UPI002A80F4CD|nr:uncharacterized protein LOC133195169 [Saccostrea echinata]